MSLHVYDPVRAARASYRLGEIWERCQKRALEEPNLDGTVDRLAARGSAELAVDRHRFRLDRVAREEEPAPDLGEREMGGEVRKQPELGTGEAHRPGAGHLRRRRQTLVHLSRINDESAHVGAE